MRDLNGAVAVVTGAGSGIGRALAQELAGRGAELALADIDSEAMEQTRRSLGGTNARTYIVDVADQGAVQNFARDVGSDFRRITLLINNAGVSLHGTFAEISIADMEWLIRINLWGAIYGCRYFLPLLLREPEAHIVNMSSVFGLIGQPGQTAYCASKFAVRGFTEALRLELKETAVKVTCVLPGGGRTAIAKNARAGAEALPGCIREDAERFDKLAPTTAAEAARAIVRGVLKNKSRLLIGADALRIDLMQRFMPVEAAGIFATSVAKRVS